MPPLNQLRLADLALALDRLTDRPAVLDPPIRILTPGARLYGPAATLLLRPGDEAADDRPDAPLAEALVVLPAGAVACLSLGGPPDPATALWDRVAAAAARAAGLAGALLDGGIADGEAARPPVACHGPALRPLQRRYTLVARDEPVAIGGVVIRPGDLVLGGADGVLVVPAEAAEAVADLAHRLAADRDREAARLDDLTRQTATRRA